MEATEWNEEEGSSSSDHEKGKKSSKVVIIILLLVANILLACLIGILFFLGYKHEACPPTPVVDQKNITDTRATDIQKYFCFTEIGCKVCPTGWLWFKDVCYTFSSIKKSWNDSQIDCENKGASLVMIESKEDQNFLKDYMDRLPFYDFWIGLYKHNDGWKWVDGRPLNISLFTEKDDFLGNCAWLSKLAGYSYTECRYLHGWICQKKTLKI